MDHDPLTDPTSLIAYRLANGYTRPGPKRRATADTAAAVSAASITIVGFVSLGFIVVAVIAVASLLRS